MQPIIIRLARCAAMATDYACNLSTKKLSISSAYVSNKVEPTYMIRCENACTHRRFRLDARTRATKLCSNGETVHVPLAFRIQHSWSNYCVPGCARSTSPAVASASSECALTLITRLHFRCSHCSLLCLGAYQRAHKAHAHTLRRRIASARHEINVPTGCLLRTKWRRMGAGLLVYTRLPKRTQR